MTADTTLAFILGLQRRLVRLLLVAARCAPYGTESLRLKPTLSSAH